MPTRRPDCPPAALRYVSRRSPVLGRHCCVASSQPLATEIGARILHRGGNAVDAAVAVAATLAVTEPCSTGLGGDAFLLYFDPATKRVHGVNGSGRVPKALTLARARADAGLPPLPPPGSTSNAPAAAAVPAAAAAAAAAAAIPAPSSAAAGVSSSNGPADPPPGNGGHGGHGAAAIAGFDKLPQFHAHTVTVPGAAAAWCDAVERFGSGRLSLAELIEPAAVLAEEGFPVGVIASHMWGLEASKLRAAPGGSALLMPTPAGGGGDAGGGRRAPRPGEVFRNPALAAVLREVGAGGRTAFYSGRVGAAVVEAVRAAGGVMAADDLTAHETTFPTPISVDYRGARVYEVPPNGQGIVALLALNILRHIASDRHEDGGGGGSNGGGDAAGGGRGNGSGASGGAAASATAGTESAVGLPEPSSLRHVELSGVAGGAAGVALAAAHHHAVFAAAEAVAAAGSDAVAAANAGSDACPCVGGGETVAQMTARLHAQIEALRFAFVDAAWFCADPAAVVVPVDELLSDGYAQRRAAGWTAADTDSGGNGAGDGSGGGSGDASGCSGGGDGDGGGCSGRGGSSGIDGDGGGGNGGGFGGGFDPRRAAADVVRGSPVSGSDTVSFQVVDAAGGAVSFVNSNYMGFGTGIVPEGCGFALQNRGENFSLDPVHPNTLAPGKRPYHTIIPGMATHAETGEFWASFTNMGGFMQPQGHVQLLSALLDRGADAQAAVDAPRFCILDGRANGGRVALEDGIPPAVTSALRRMGHDVVTVEGEERSYVFGRAQVIVKDEAGVLWCGSDGRGDGCGIAW